MSALVTCMNLTMQKKASSTQASKQPRNIHWNAEHSYCLVSDQTFGTSKYSRGRKSACGRSDRGRTELPATWRAGGYQCRARARRAGLRIKHFTNTITVEDAMAAVRTAKNK